MTKMATTIEENRMKTSETSAVSKPFSESFAAAAARNAQHSTEATAENASPKKVADKKSEAAKTDAAPPDRDAIAAPATGAGTAATLSNPMAFTLQHGGSAGAENESVASTQHAEPSMKASQSNDSTGTTANRVADSGTASATSGTHSATASAGAANTGEVAEDRPGIVPDQTSGEAALTDTVVPIAGNAEVTTHGDGASSPEMVAASSSAQALLLPMAGVPGLAAPGQIAQPVTSASGAASAAPTGTKKSGVQEGSTAASASTDALAGLMGKPHESAPEPQQGTDFTSQQTAHSMTLSNAAAHTGSSGSQSNDSSTAGEAATTPPRSADASPQWDSAAQPVVHSAQLIQAMHGSEMRMGMSSAEFGNISITASLTHQTLTAQISLDHAGLTRALTAQIPGMEAKLGHAYGLQSRVEVRDGSSTAQGGSQGRQPEQQTTHSNFAASGGRAGGQSAALLTLPAALVPPSSTRLDVLI